MLTVPDKPSRSGTWAEGTGDEKWRFPGEKGILGRTKNKGTAAWKNTGTQGTVEETAEERWIFLDGGGDR